MRKISKIKTKPTKIIGKAVEKQMEADEPQRKQIDVDKLVSTGSTTFNLECSGHIEGAFKLGTIVNLIGDSHAGKTLFALTILAESCLLPQFDNYRLIYDDVEAANEFDIEYLFGKKVADRIELDVRSRTIEDFNDNLSRTCSDADNPCIYITDSFDALTSEAAIEKDEENRKKREKGNQTSGSYGDGKAKKASEMFSQRTQEIDQSESFVLIISQTRDNIGFGAMFTPKTRSGGKALKFYSAHEVWLACQKKEKKGKRTVVTNVQAKITKNKLTGRHGECYFPVLFDYGVDNISSCINFLFDEGDWTGTKKSINSKGFADNMSMVNLVLYIEENDLEEDLFQKCQETYDAIMEKLKPKRKRKY